MNTHSIRIWCLLMVLTAGASARTDAPSTLTDLDGRPAKLESHTANGDWLVVMIWASDCHICNAEAAAYDAFHRAQRGADIGVLGISMDGEDKRSEARDFVKRHALSFPNLIGEPGMVALYYVSLTQESLRGTPTFLIFGPDGGLAAAQAGAVPVDAVERFIFRKKLASSKAQ